MKTRLLLVIGMLGWLARSEAQIRVQVLPLSGKVIDSLTRKPLERAVIAVVNWGKKDTLRLLTDADGRFLLEHEPPKDFLINASFVGYQTKQIHYTSAKDGLGVIALSPRIHEMDEVIIEAPAITLKEDTVEFRADAYPVRKDAVLEDLLKRLPGVSVDKNGNVTANGRPVPKIRVNGRDFFVGDPQLATQNIPADVIDKIQLIDDKSDQAKFSGFDDGERTQVINITIKKSRSDSYFGDLSVGGGTDSRYLAGGKVFRFDQDKQLAFIGNSNNTNGNNVTSGGAASGPAVNSSNTAGLNYSGTLAPHLTVTGSYQFSDNQSTNVTNSSRTYDVDTIYTYNQNQQVNNHSYNHSLQMTVGYGMGPHDSVIVSPSLNLSSNRQQTYNVFSFLDSTNTTTSNGSQNYSARTSSPNLSGLMTWMHKFDKKGRTFSMSANVGPGPARETDNNFSTNHIYYPSTTDTIWQVSDMKTQKRQYSLTAYYTEPLGKTSALQLDYTFRYNQNISDRNVYDLNSGLKVFNDSLSNSFDNALTTNRLGIKFRETQKKYNYQLGIGIQPTDMTSRSVIMDTLRSFNQRTWQIVPIGSFHYELTPSKRIQFYYTGYTQQPSITQLQPVPDYTNPLYIALGNPNLKPSFANNFRLSYNDIDKLTGRSFFLNASTQIRNNAIVNDVTYGTGGQQTVQPVNVSGVYTFSGSYDYSVPFHKRTYILSASGGANYANNVGLVDGMKTVGHNWVGNQSLRFQYVLQKWLELNTTIGYSINTTSYGDTTPTRTVGTWAFSQDGRVDFLKEFSFRYTFSYTLNQGLGGSVPAGVTLMSMVLERRLFKEQGILALSVNDLFDDNSNISYVSQVPYQETDRTTVLNRFFLLSFTWKFQQFRGPHPPGH